MTFSSEEYVNIYRWSELCPKTKNEMDFTSKLKVENKFC